MINRIFNVVFLFFFTPEAYAKLLANGREDEF